MRLWRCYLSSFLSPSVEQQAVIRSFAFTKLICNWHKVRRGCTSVQWAARTPPPLPVFFIDPATSDWAEGSPLFHAPLPFFYNGWHVVFTIFDFNPKRKGKTRRKSCVSLKKKKKSRGESQKGTKIFFFFFEIFKISIQKLEWGCK